MRHLINKYPQHKSRKWYSRLLSRLSGNFPVSDLPPDSARFEETAYLLQGHVLGDLGYEVCQKPVKTGWGRRLITK